MKAKSFPSLFITDKVIYAADKVSYYRIVLSFLPKKMIVFELYILISINWNSLIGDKACGKFLLQNQLRGCNLSICRRILVIEIFFLDRQKLIN